VVVGLLWCFLWVDLCSAGAAAGFSAAAAFSFLAAGAALLLCLAGLDDLEDFDLEGIAIGLLIEASIAFSALVALTVMARFSGAIPAWAEVEKASGAATIIAKAASTTANKRFIVNSFKEQVKEVINSDQY
jgi:hypothetical protein